MAGDAVEPPAAPAENYDSEVAAQLAEDVAAGSSHAHDDIAMADSFASGAAPSPAPAAVAIATPAARANSATPTPAQTPAPAGTSTPVPGSTATATTIPDKATSHGAPVRRYLNENVTTTLLEGMRMLAKEQPPNPLRVLGEFLLRRSDEIERR